MARTPRSDSADRLAGPAATRRQQPRPRRATSPVPLPRAARSAWAPRGPESPECHRGVTRCRTRRRPAGPRRATPAAPKHDQGTLRGQPLASLPASPSPWAPSRGPKPARRDPWIRRTAGRRRTAGACVGPLHTRYSSPRRPDAHCAGLHTSTASIRPPGRAGPEGPSYRSGVSCRRTLGRPGSVAPCHCRAETRQLGRGAFLLGQPLGLGASRSSAPLMGRSPPARWRCSTPNPRATKGLGGPGTLRRRTSRCNARRTPVHPRAGHGLADSLPVAWAARAETRSSPRRGEAAVPSRRHPELVFTFPPLHEEAVCRVGRLPSAGLATRAPLVFGEPADRGPLADSDESCPTVGHRGERLQPARPAPRRSVVRHTRARSAHASGANLDSRAGHAAPPGPKPARRQCGAAAAVPWSDSEGPAPRTGSSPR
jgi:hypothetical protein